jgi:protein Mpv17
MGTVGLVQGLPNHIWYTWLDRFLPGKSLMTVGKKIVADQVICSPISSASFFVGAGMLEGCSMSQGWEEYKSKFLLVYIVSKIVYFLIGIYHSRIFFNSEMICLY